MLGYSYDRLINGKKLTVAYFGASITEGASASEHDLYSYRALTTKWLRDTYPDCEITEINASIGGTASDFAVFRIEDDLLSKSPDLIFIEFCTNDSVLTDSTLYEETLIRRIRRRLPLADAVHVRLLQRKMFEKSLRDEYDDSYLYYEKLARRYEMPFLDLGEALYSHIRRGDGDYRTYTKDDVHPNDFGHSILADAAIGFLKRELRPASFGERTPVEPLTSDKYMKAGMIRAASCRDTDFSIAENSFYSDHGYLFSDEAGKYIRLRFTGSVAGAVFQIAHDSGDFLWRVDGGEYKRVSTWDEYALRFDRTNYRVLTDSLTPGDHILEIVCTGEKNERSDGAFVRISDFLTA